VSKIVAFFIYIVLTVFPFQRIVAEEPDYGALCNLAIDKKIQSLKNKYPSDNCSLHQGLTKQASELADVRTTLEEERLRELEVAKERLGTSPQQISKFKEELAEKVKSHPQAKSVFDNASVNGSNGYDLSYSGYPEDRECGSAAAYMYPATGKTRAKMNVCSNGFDWGQGLNLIAHEGLHLSQFGMKDLTSQLTFDFNGGKQVSKTAQSYTMDPKTLKKYSANKERFNEIQKEIPKPISTQTDQLFKKLDEVEKLFFISTSSDGKNIEFTPKKPSTVSDKEFDDKLEAFLSKGSLRFSVPSFADWSSKEKDSAQSSKKEMLKKYLQSLKSEYQKI
jgi:hypothetical protein